MWICLSLPSRKSGNLESRFLDQTLSCVLISRAGKRAERQLVISHNLCCERILTLYEPIAQNEKGTLFHNRSAWWAVSVAKGYQSLEWRKSAYPSSESSSSSSSALNLLEWNPLSSLLPLSLLFIFHLGISTFPPSVLPRCGAYTLLFFLSCEGKASRKAWCCTWKRDFWLGREPTSNKHTWSHSWIFFCCSGTYGYIMKVWDLRGHEGVWEISGPDNGLCAYSSPLFRSTASPHVTKAIL